MGFLQKIAQYFAPIPYPMEEVGAIPKRRPALRRSYQLASVDRLTNDFLAPITTGDVELRISLPTMRARSRELERNNDYAKKFLHMVEINVVGKSGFTLQSRARDLSGILDQNANNIIESEFKKWGNRKYCTVDGRMSWVKVQKLVIRSVARDGECLVRMVRGFKNPWRFALQILEGDVLDETLNISDGPGQNLIKMGVEYNEWDRPIAYHIRKKHPGDYFRSGSPQTYQRIPANEIIHIYDIERASQGRGIPWMRTAALRMNILGEYEKTELIGARIGASQMGFYIPSPEGGADIVPDDEDSEGNPIMEAEPGMFEKLPTGYSDFKPFLPVHPSGNYGDFSKETKRGLASGLNVAYNSIANDLEKVNFSSMRIGTVEERDAWQSVQGFFVTDFLELVREAWLEMLLLSDRTSLPYSKFDKFNSADFQGRRWDWVDPLKDIEADLMAIRAGLKSPQQVASERGMELEDIYELIAEAQKLAKKYNLKLDYGASVGKAEPTGDETAAPEGDIE